jgi:hypothetical protein
VPTGHGVISDISHDMSFSWTATFNGGHVYDPVSSFDREVCNDAASACALYTSVVNLRSAPFQATSARAVIVDLPSESHRSLVPVLESTS